MFQEDLNTSTSWDLIDPDQAVNASTDSTQAKPDRELEEVSNIILNQDLGTLDNQDFFVADMTGRRLSQIPHKLNYPYPLPNGHSALQLRLPDLLIYLKMDTYLIDVNTGNHYAIYSDRIQKMSISPKFYSAWDTGNCYKQFKMIWCQLTTASNQWSIPKHTDNIKAGSTISCGSVHAATSFPMQTHHCQI